MKTDQPITLFNQSIDRSLRSVDIPDPYVILSMAHAPHSWRKTTVKDNDVNPEWNETFTFHLDPDQKHILGESNSDERACG